MIIAITQARMSSSRYPGKVLKTLFDHPMAWHQLQRTKRAKLLDRCILATSSDPSDDELANYFINNNELVYRGSLNNVLSRYYECAKQYNATHVVRLTADCPLIDPLVIDKVIASHLDNDNDYTCTHLYPIGISVEVCKFDVLKTAYYEANLRSQREHVTLFIYKHPERFKIGQLSYKEDLSDLRWTVDYKEDFEFVSRVYQALYPDNKNFGIADILKLLEQHPEFAELNSHFTKNEGLIKSLEQDSTMTYLDN